MSWYPGHMEKAIVKLKENIKLVDAVIEVVDARIPYSTKNPYIAELAKNKYHIILFSKTDLADSSKIKKWKDFFSENNEYTVFYSSKNKGSINNLYKILSDIKQDILQKKERLFNYDLKIMIVGLPNVGKSTLINFLKGKKSTKVGNLPGVTKSLQWVKLADGTLLLDTPGILNRSKKDKVLWNNLVFFNSSESEEDISDIAYKLIENLKILYPNLLEDRYQINANEETLEIMNIIGRKRGMLLKGAEIDYDRVSRMIVDEFRNGIIGNVTFEVPDDLVGR